MRRSIFFIKFYFFFCLLFMVVLFKQAYSQEVHDDLIYLLKSNWSAAKDMRDATYLMEVIKENDTSYTCRYYYKTGSMIRQEVFLDSDLSVPNGRFCWYDAKGNLDSTGWVHRGKKNGAWNFYNDDFEPTLSIVYDKSRFTEKRNYQTNVYTDETGNTSRWSEFSPRRTRPTGEDEECIYKSKIQVQLFISKKWKWANYYIG